MYWCKCVSGPIQPLGYARHAPLGITPRVEESLQVSDSQTDRIIRPMIFSPLHLLHRILGEPVGCNNDDTQKCRLQKHLQQDRENQPRHANLSTLSQHGILEDCLQESWRAGRLNFTFLYLVPYLLLSSSSDLVILLKSRTAASQLP